MKEFEPQEGWGRIPSATYGPANGSEGTRIFPRGGGTPTPIVGALIYYFCDFLAENCMKTKGFGPGGARPWRPLGSANEIANNIISILLFYAFRFFRTFDILN